MRNNKIVNIRALAIVLVVLGHSIILYLSQWDLYTTINSVPILDNFKKVIDIIQMPLFFPYLVFYFIIQSIKNEVFLNL